MRSSPWEALKGTTSFEYSAGGGKTSVRRARARVDTDGVVVQLDEIGAAGRLGTTSKFHDCHRIQSRRSSGDDTHPVSVTGLTGAVTPFADRAGVHRLHDGVEATLHNANTWRAKHSMAIGTWKAGDVTKVVRVGIRSPDAQRCRALRMPRCRARSSASKTR